MEQLYTKDMKCTCGEHVFRIYYSYNKAVCDRCKKEYPLEYKGKKDKPMISHTR
jgi:hypothetical protein